MISKLSSNQKDILNRVLNVLKNKQNFNRSEKPLNGQLLGIDILLAASSACEN